MGNGGRPGAGRRGRARAAELAKGGGRGARPSLQRSRTSERWHRSRGEGRQCTCPQLDFDLGPWLRWSELLAHVAEVGFVGRGRCTSAVPCPRLGVPYPRVPACAALRATLAYMDTRRDARGLANGNHLPIPVGQPCWRLGEPRATLPSRRHVRPRTSLIAHLPHPIAGRHSC